MPARIDAVCRFVVRLLLAIFTAVVVLLAQSALWLDDVGILQKAILVAAAVAGFIRPRDGLLLLAGLLPLAELGSRFLHSWIRGGEALALAYLAGALLHEWRGGRADAFPRDSVDTAALCLGLVSAASCVEQLWFIGIQSDFPRPFLERVAAYARRDYLEGFNGLGMVAASMLLLEGVALLTLVRRYSRDQPELAHRLLRMVVVGSAAAALSNLAYVAARFLEAGAAWRELPAFFLFRRWTEHVGDYNAAASFFAIGLFTALGGAVAAKGKSAYWWTGALAIGIAMWMTGSRTAALSTAIVVAGVAVSKYWASERRLLSMAAILGLVALAVMAFFRVFPNSAVVAVEIRWMFLQTTMRMLEWQPLFGVGIGQYGLWTKHFSSPDLLRYDLENAHNNYAQIAGELGLAGLAALLALLVVALLAWRRARTVDPMVKGAALGSLAFVLSWMGGHPLLVPEVAHPFWIVLGVVTASAPAAKAWLPARTLGPIALAIALAASVPFRVESKSRTIDWTKVTYGFYDWEDGPGFKVRWTGLRARMFVHSAAGRVGIPMRALHTSPESPVIVNIRVDERLADQVRLEDTQWRTVRVPFRTNGEDAITSIELDLNRTWVPAEANHRNQDTRRLGIQTGEVIPGF